MADDRATPRPTASAAPAVDPAVELSERRTGLSFQRTRMSADRTLMSVLRTSLSLISFGFTIFQFFKHLPVSEPPGRDAHAARNFGLALVSLGILMLVFGIAYHSSFMLQLRRERRDLVATGLLHGESRFPASLTLITAVLLLLIGLLAIASIAFRFGPFN